MLKVNENYSKLGESYLFSTIAKKINEFKDANPDREVIRLGIGDVTMPLTAPVVKAMKDAADEVGTKDGFKGYGPEQGYAFLREAIKGYYAKNGTTLEANEIFVSDGAKSDVANILDLFDVDNKVLIPNPVYPVYLDTNIMHGREVIFLDATADNNFSPMPPKDISAELIYLCSPNNPTGASYSKEELSAWVDYANKNGAVILYDAAYEAFITDDSPRSIFEIDGAKTCAIEFCSLSKTAGFTGTRCGYTVVPMDLKAGDVSLNKMWLRRQTTKFNGVSYIVQRGAEAVFIDEGMASCMENIAYYRNNASVIAKALDEVGVWYCGGKNSPYIWLKCPEGLTSWEFFDILLEKGGVVGTPGSGFGSQGEGYFRLTGFGDADNTVKAAAKLKEVLLSFKK